MLVILRSRVGVVAAATLFAEGFSRGDPLANHQSVFDVPASWKWAWWWRWRRACSQMVSVSGVITRNTAGIRQGPRYGIGWIRLPSDGWGYLRIWRRRWVRGSSLRSSLVSATARQVELNARDNDGYAKVWS